MVEEIKDSFTEVIQSFIDFIPGLVAAIVLLVVGKFVAGFVANLFQKLLKAVNFDGIVDKSGLGTHVANAGYPDSGFLRRRSSASSSF